MSSTHYPNGQRIPAWKRALKFTGKVAGGTVIALVTASLFSLLVLGGAITGLLNGMKAESSAADDTAFPETSTSAEAEDNGQAIGPPPTVADGDATIVLEATASGPATVTWSGPGSFGNTEAVDGTWTKEFPNVDPQEFYNVSVSSDDYETETAVSCKITVDGEVPPDGEAAANGVAAIADCNKAMFD